MSQEQIHLTIGALRVTYTRKEQGTKHHIEVRSEKGRLLREVKWQATNLSLAHPTSDWQAACFGSPFTLEVWSKVDYLAKSRPTQFFFLLHRKLNGETSPTLSEIKKQLPVDYPLECYFLDENMACFLAGEPVTLEARYHSLQAVLASLEQAISDLSGHLKFTFSVAAHQLAARHHLDNTPLPLIKELYGANHRLTIEETRVFTQLINGHPLELIASEVAKHLAST